MPCRGLRFVLSVVFYVVNENPQNRIRLKSCKKQKKTPEAIGFQVLFGAAGRIRTADLILTNGTATLLKRIIAPQNPRFGAVFHCFLYHFVPYLSDLFYSGSSQIVVKK
jgi:hypothetical protein